MLYLLKIIECVSTCPLLGTDKDPDFSVVKDIINVIFWNGDKAV